MAIVVARGVGVVLNSNALNDNIDVALFDEAGNAYTPTGNWWCLVYYSGVNSASDVCDNAGVAMGWGMAVGSGGSFTTRCGCAGYTSDNQSTSVAYKTGFADGILKTIIDAVNINGALDIVGGITSNMRFIVDDAFSTTVRFQVLLVDGLTAAAIDNVLAPATTPPISANHTITVSDPDLLIFLSPGPTTVATFVGSSLQLDFSAAHADGQFVTSIISRNGQNPNTTYRYAYDGECISNLGVTGAPVERAAKQAGAWSNTVSGTTLSLNWLEKQATGNIHFCAQLKGVEATIVKALTQTNTSTAIPVTGLSTPCQGGIVVSHCEALNAQDTGANEHHWSMGSFNRTASQGVHATRDQAGISPNKANRAVGYSTVYQNIGTSDAVVGKMALQSKDSNGATYIMTASDSAQVDFFSILFADPTAPAAGKGRMIGRQPIASMFGRLV